MNQRLNKRNRSRKHPIAEINVVPYIDVMLVLLIIFMITAPLLTQGVHVNLPKTSAKPLSAKAPMPMIVSIDRAGNYFLNTAKKPDLAISAQNLMSSVHDALEKSSQSTQPQPIYVKGDKDANYGKIVSAMVLLQQAGAKDVGLITEPISTDST